MVSSVTAGAAEAPVVGAVDGLLAAPLLSVLADPQAAATTANTNITTTNTNFFILITSKIIFYM
ncbi:hypothetical protein D3C73_1439880 [compost metagenome]